MMREIFSGIVENVHRNEKYSDVTLSSFDYSPWKVRDFRIYRKIPEGYIGKPVDIIIERGGLFGGKFRQEISSSRLKHFVEIPYNLARKIDIELRENRSKKEIYRGWLKTS